MKIKKTYRLIIKSILALYLLLSICLYANAQAESFNGASPDEILVIYNVNDIDNNNNNIVDSKELAEYYRLKRNVPAVNMLGLQISVSTYYYNDRTGWTKFWDEIVLPIREKLSQLGETQIKYILLCDQIPYQLLLEHGKGVSLDNSLALINNLGTRNAPNIKSISNPYYESSPTNGADKGNFNHTDYKINGNNMYLVSRLIAKDVDNAKNLIDMALYGEKFINVADGYYNGIAYVDTRYKHYTDAELKYSYHNSLTELAKFDKNAAYIKFFYQELGMSYKWEPYETEIGEIAAKYTDGTSAITAPNALLYGGWYNFGRYFGGYEWMPGAVACDLNSNSGANIRNGNTSSFLSGAFADGLTCGLGCIGEPYLDGHSQVDIFMYYFLKGYNFIEAAYLSEPKVKFQGIIVGDPLYNPYAKNKLAVKDLEAHAPNISLNFVSAEETHISLDYNNASTPEVVKATIMWGETLNYGDTIDYGNFYKAQHNFKLMGLNNTTTYHYEICVADPVGNKWCSDDNTFRILMK